jgi:acyl carrier protein
MSEDDAVATLIAFIREKFLSGDNGQELTESTPLLEWGILDSLSTAVLLKFIREELGVTVPPSAVDARNFKDVRSIAAMVCQSATVPSS